jgi:hypothetical protein
MGDTATLLSRRVWLDALWHIKPEKERMDVHAPDPTNYLRWPKL